MEETDNRPYKFRNHESDSWMYNSTKTWWNTIKRNCSISNLITQIFDFGQQISTFKMQQDKNKKYPLGQQISAFIMQQDKKIPTSDCSL